MSTKEFIDLLMGKPVKEGEKKKPSKGYLVKELRLLGFISEDFC